MKVFLSWSGSKSKFVAEALHKWLPRALQAVKPWMSQEDISVGSRWSAEIAGELEVSKVGIICVTRENQHKPWLMFEAGALSKVLKDTFVCPLLIDVNVSEFSGPLSQFQSVGLDQDGVGRILNTLNTALKDGGLATGEIQEVLTVWWNSLDRLLQDIPKSVNEPQRRSTEEILEEILSNTREQLRRDEIRYRSAKSLEKDVFFDDSIRRYVLSHPDAFACDTPGLTKSFIELFKYALNKNAIHVSFKNTQSESE